MLDQCSSHVGEYNNDHMNHVVSTSEEDEFSHEWGNEQVEEDIWRSISHERMARRQSLFEESEFSMALAELFYAERAMT